MATHTDAFPDLQRELCFQTVDNPSPVSLTPAQLAQFNEHGFILPLDVFTPAEAAANRAYFDALMAQASAKGWNSYSINGWHLRCEGLYRLCIEPRILDYVQDLLGENLVCWGTHYFCKLPGDTKRVSWHQDASYWPLTPSRTVTVWLAIDDVDEENGAMKVIPGSHRLGQIGFDDSAPEEENVLYQSVNDAARYGGPPVSINLKAGQISLHSDLLLHGSEPNPSSRRRCGLTMRFVPPTVRAHKGWNRNAIVARGSDPDGHWVANPCPQGETIPDKN